MKHSFLDKYSDGDSLIHRLDPRAKLLATLAFVAAVVLTPAASWLAFGLYFAVIAVMLLLSRVPPAYIIRRSLVILPFVLLVAIFIPFFKEGGVATTVNLWGWHISLTRNGLELLGSILAKSWLSILSLLALTSTTGFTELLKGMEKLRVPGVMVMLLSFMYRYLFLLTDEVMRMKQARDSRSFGGKRLWQVKTAGNMIGTLFIRSYERGERVYASMVARGFDGHSRTLENLHFRCKDAVFITALSLALVAISLSNILY
ncbi:cobalt ECF transporter T component CbiQ [Chloroflexota bacterium]